MKTLVVTLADLEGVPHGSTLAHTKVKVEARYTSDLTLADGRIIPAAVKEKEIPSTGERTFEVWASDDPAVAESSRGFAVIVTATITPTRGGGGARVQRTVKPLMSMDDVIHLGTLSPAEPVPPQWSTVDDMLADVEASRAAAQGAKTAAEAAVEAVGPAAQAAAAPAVAAAQSAQEAAEGIAADLDSAIEERLYTWDRIQQDVGTGRLFFAAPPLPPILADDFNRPDESPVGASPVGAKTLTPGTGWVASTFAVRSGQLAFLSAGAAVGLGVWYVGQADGTLAVTVADVGASGGLFGHGVIFRAQDTTWANCYTLDGNGTDGAYRLLKRADGVTTLIAKGLGAPANGDRIEVEMSGTSLTVRINGTQRWTGTDTGPTGTGMGVYLYQQRLQVRYDDVSFDRIGA